MDERAVDELRSLADRDAELAARAARLRELDGEVASLRTAAEEIDAFFAAYPAEESGRRAALTEADAELTRRRAELAAAQAEAGQARDAESRERAEHAAERARDHLAVAEGARSRAQASADELERDAASLPHQVPALEERARTIAAEVDHLPTAPRGPRALGDWASHAHAALFVAAGQLDAQRDRVIREANELASMLTGEPAYGSTVAGALGRVIAIHRDG